MQWLAEVCVKRPIFAAVLVLLVSVVGVAGYTKLGLDRFPNIDLPIVIITTRLPGAAPEDVETEITDKVEEAVNTVSGIDEITSITSEGVSQVVVRFVLEKNPDVGSSEVRDRLQLIIPDLPKGIDLPVVQRLDPDAAPVIYLALRWPGKDVKDVTELADKRVRRYFEAVSGVGQVAVVGGQKRQINVWLDPARMRAVNISAIDVQRAIGSQNITLPGGRVDTGPEQLTLRIHGRVENPDQIGDIVVRQEAGHSIRVRDIGGVEDGGEEPQSVALLNGEPSVVLAIRKQSGSNTVEVVDAVRARLEDLKRALPPGATVDTIRDDSGVIRTSVNGVKEHLVVGALLAALVVYLFLGSIRSTIIAAVAIPVSIIGTFAMMWWMHFTLNTITLLALALAVGIVIDDAIVVLENVFRFVDEKGYGPKQATILATREIGLAVLATTLSLIAVFAPVAFLGGIPGRFLSSFGVTMACAIAISLFVSFTLTPMMTSRLLKKKVEGAQKPLGERVTDFFYRPVERVYMVALRFAMKRRWVIVVAAAATLASCAPLSGAAKKGFLPVNDEAHFEIVVRAPEGTSLRQTQLISERVARDIREWPEVERTVLTIADDNARTQNIGRVYVRLVPPEKRHISQNELMDRARHDIVSKQDKSLRIAVQEVAAIGGGGFSTAKIQYTVRGPDLKQLEETTAHVLEKLRKVPGAVDVDSSLITGKPEIGAFVDRARAADLGVSVSDTAAALRLLVDGDKVSAYEENGEQYDIRVRAEKQFRADEGGLGMLTLPSPRLGLVPLRSVVDLKHGTGPAQINHLNRQRVVTILSNVAPGVSEAKIADTVAQLVKDEKLPATYTAEPTGQTREMKRVFTSFAAALLIAFIIMYLVLAAQFESLLHPLTILLSSLPLTFPFAVLSIVLFKQALDMYSVLGILVLFGIVKKNAILQIDHTNQLRQKGLSREEAILQGNKDRLRPILMTTAAFVAGMLPLVLSEGIGAAYNRATAGVIVGGQVFSLLLTLLATPVAYSFFDDIASFFRRVLFKNKDQGEEEDPPSGTYGEEATAAAEE